MILIHPDYADLAEAVIAAAPDGHTVKAVRSEVELITNVATASVCVLAVDLRNDGMALIWTVQNERPLLPIVLVTSADWSNARLLGKVVVAEAVARERVNNEMAAALRRVLEASAREPLARILETRSDLHPLVRSATVTALRQDPPFRTGKAWLRRLELRRRQSVAEAWPSTWRAAGLTPAEFLRSVRVVRAAELWQELQDWDHVASSLGCTRPTIKNWTCKYSATGGAVRELESPGAAAALATRLADKML